eukprot:TRINITY_DN1694_c0_g1_i1.p1 TRINITY_DN1694_c0_g1~~TRINITY_DN1694_c0_g1_i1.p1  ORF type:complete len:111 (-),score=18.84 TRINITY_DN1694_c0_g1_i1:410-742(-)
MGAASSQDMSPNGSIPSGFELRVRDTDSALEAYRRVVVPFANPSGARPGLHDIRSRICNKFKDVIDTHPSSPSTKHVQLLVRIRDRLEVCDDEDASILTNGDRLEVTFSY